MKHKITTTNQIVKENGFTLLELLIALVLVAFISFFTAQSLKQTVRSSKKIQKDIDINSEIQSAMNLIRSDIARAYNTRDLYIAIYNEAQREHIKRWKEEAAKPAGAAPNPNTPSTPGNPTPATPTVPNSPQVQLPQPEYKERKEIVLTKLIGGKDKIDFTSLNGNAIRKNSNTSELTEVGYFTKNCKSRGRDKKDSDCLWRRLSYYLDGDVEEGGQESVLIENVTLFELKYLRKLNDDEMEWRESWAEDDINTQNRLPLAIEVTLEITITLDKDGKETKKKRVVAYIPIDFENNKNISEIIKMNSQGDPSAPQQNPSPGSGFDNSGFQDSNSGFDSNDTGGF
jgi:prepilin-type N-terminal cleavage/methylation domain-containing protein